MLCTAGGDAVAVLAEQGPDHRMKGVRVRTGASRPPSGRAHAAADRGGDGWRGRRRAGTPPPGLGHPGTTQHSDIRYARATSLRERWRSRELSGERSVESVGTDFGTGMARGLFNPAPRCIKCGACAFIRRWRLYRQSSVGEIPVGVAPAATHGVMALVLTRSKRPCE